MIFSFPNLKEGVWTYDLKSNQGRGSARLQQILGLDLPEGHITPELFDAAVHPEESSGWETRWNSLISSPEGTDWEWEGRIRTPKGGWKWIRLAAQRKGDQVHGICEDVTRTRELELRLKESEDQWAALVDALPVTLRIVSSKGTIMFVNAQGLPGDRQELSSRFPDLFTGPEKQEAEDFLDQIFAGTGGSLMTAAPATASGLRHFRHTASLLPGHREALVVSMEVTQQYRWEHLQLLEQDRLQALVYAQSLSRDNEAETIRFLLDTAAHLTASTGSFFGETGVNPRQLMRLSLLEAGNFTVEDSPTAEIHWNQLINNRANAYAPGKSKPYFSALNLDREDALLMVPVSLEGRIKALAGVMGKPGIYEEEEIRTFELFVQGLWEILQRKRTEQALIQSQRIETIGQMAAGVAHDFNNLLAAILGFTSLAKMRVRNPDALEPVLDKIESAGRKGAQLVQSVLNFGRKQDFHPVPLDLAVHVETSRRLYGSLLPSALKLTLRVCGPGLYILGDPDLLDQALLNLISNSRDALESAGIPEGLLVLEAGRWTDPPPLFPEPADWTGPWVYLKVSDNGPGIPKSAQDRLFEPFFTTKPVGKGTGLGLPVVKNIVTQHKGQIILSSEPGKETSFTLFFPQTTLQEER